MKRTPMALSVLIVLMAGCASMTPPVATSDAESARKAQDPELHDPLTRDYKFSCTVPPGPGCC